MGIKNTAIKIHWLPSLIRTTWARPFSGSQRKSLNVKSKGKTIAILNA